MTFAIGDWIKLLGGIGSVGTGIMSAFQREQMPFGTQQAAQALSNSQTYLNAAGDPSSPYFQNMAAEEERRGRGDLIASVGEILRQNAASKGLGFVNPERRDEATWGVLAKGFQEAGLRAREIARQRLLDMAGASRNIASSYAPFAQTGWLQQLLNRGSRNAGISGSFAALGPLGDQLNKMRRGQQTGAHESAHENRQGTVQFGQSSVPDWWSESYDAGTGF